MKKIIGFLSVCLLVAATVSVRGQQVYGTETFGVTEGSREHDYSGEAEKRITVLTFDVWNRALQRAELTWEDAWLELDSLVVEFLRYHNPAGTMDVVPTVATVADLTDIRLENTQGEVVAVGHWETVLPVSWVEEVSPPGSMNQMVFESVQPPKRFRGETLFLSVVPGKAFVTDDAVCAGVRKMTVRSRAGAETIEPYPEWGAFVSTGTIIVNPAVLTVAVSPTTPKSLPATGNVAVVLFEVKAKSIRPGNQMLWRGWQLEFEVSAGVVSSLGTIKVLNANGQLIKEQAIITRGDNPRRGMVSLEEQDDGRSSGYSLKDAETLTVTFSTAGLQGTDITVTSRDIWVADFGTGGQYGGLVSSGTSSSVSVVSTMVHVELPPAPSGGGGGNGGPVIQPPVLLNPTVMFERNDTAFTFRVIKDQDGNDWAFIFVDDRKLSPNVQVQYSRNGAYWYAIPDSDLLIGSTRQALAFQVQDAAKISIIVYEDR